MTSQITWLLRNLLGVLTRGVPVSNLSRGQMEDSIKGDLVFTSRPFRASRYPARVGQRLGTIKSSRC